jgi:hypothetical protein
MSGPARNGVANVAGLLLASTTSGGMNGTTTVAPRAHPRGATADHAGDKANTGADDSIGTAEKLDGSPVC